MTMTAQRLTGSAAVHTVRPDVPLAALTVRVPVHSFAHHGAGDADGDVIEVPVIVHHIDADTTEVLIDGGVVGYIRSDGHHHFAALAGHALRDAMQCGTADLWDLALAQLFEASRR